MKKIIVLLVSVLLISGLGMLTACTNDSAEEKYVLYVGFPEKTDEEKDAIINKINEICKNHIQGFTLCEGTGGWTDDSGKFIEEDTLIYSFNFTDRKKVAAIANEVLDTVSESAVLFETQYTSAVHSSSENFPK